MRVDRHDRLAEQRVARRDERRGAGVEAPVQRQLVRRAPGRIDERRVQYRVRQVRVDRADDVPAIAAVARFGADGLAIGDAVDVLQDAEEAEVPAPHELIEIGAQADELAVRVEGVPRMIDGIAERQDSA